MHVMSKDVREVMERHVSIMRGYGLSYRSKGLSANSDFHDSSSTYLIEPWVHHVNFSMQYTPCQVIFFICMHTLMKKILRATQLFCVAGISRLSHSSPRTTKVPKFNQRLQRDRQRPVCLERHCRRSSSNRCSIWYFIQSCTTLLIYWKSCFLFSPSFVQIERGPVNIAPAEHIASRQLVGLWIFAYVPQFTFVIRE